MSNTNPEPVEHATAGDTTLSSVISARQLFKDVVDRVVQRVQALSLDLSTALEVEKPGHQHGFKKHYEHVTRMVDELPGLCVAYRLSPELAELARAVFSAHDLGRPVEALIRLKGEKPSKMHGALGVDELRKHRTLDGLDERQTFLVEFAVHYHSERMVPNIDEIEVLAAGALGGGDAAFIARDAYNLTYFLRDRDKVEILSKGHEYATAPFVLLELRTWFFDKNELHSRRPFDEALLRTPEFRATAENVLAFLLDSDSRAAVPSSGTSLELEIIPVLSDIMNRGIEPRTGATFLSQLSCEKSLIGYSWATYMLYATAFVFDVRHAATLNEITSRELLRPWMGFLENKLPPAEYVAYTLALTDYIDRRTLKP